MVEAGHDVCSIMCGSCVFVLVRGFMLQVSRECDWLSFSSGRFCSLGTFRAVLDRMSGYALHIKQRI